MSNPQTPRVKLPNVTTPKTRGKTPTATKPDKYEHKPMPPTPLASPSSAPKCLFARKNPSYIQPAIPLQPSGPAITNMKNRAATDPVIPKPLFISTTSTVNQLRKDFSQTGNRRSSGEDEENVVHRPTSPPPMIAHKASQLLGVLPVQKTMRATPPGSAPPSTHTPDPFRSSTEDEGGRHASPSRQIHSTPIPTQRYRRENNLTLPSGGRASQESKEASEVLGGEKKQSTLKEESDGSLKPPQVGAHGRRGEVEYVAQIAMQRVPSVAGIIEDSDSPEERGDQAGPSSAKANWEEHTHHPQYSGEVLYPNVYSPNTYAGVWENDPNVGRTLPPFSPFPQEPDPEAHQRAVSDTSRDVPIILQRFPGESSYGSGYSHSLRSQNSWAPSGSGNSFAQAGPPSSGAGTTPRVPTHMRYNSVPPPPLSYPGFQRSEPSPPSLVQMERNLHHHIESCFQSLMRSTTDSSDRTVDKLLKRIENLQESVEKGWQGITGDLKELNSDLKGIKVEIMDTRKELTHMRKETNRMRKELEKANERGTRSSESLKDSMGSLSEQFNHIDKKIDGMGNRFHLTARDMSEGEQELSSTCSQERASPQRRSGSTRTSGSLHPEQRPANLGGATRTSAVTQASTDSSKGRHSNTINTNGADGKRSDDRSTGGRVQMASRPPHGLAPDLRDHPAYKTVVEGFGGNNSFFRAPDLNQNWYEDAFGHRP
ncbi:MAG: hypothetical protein Q9219_004153 [cf. Caloplaca sp. 3 TL-2023]